MAQQEKGEKQMMVDQKQRKRSIAIALILGAMVVLFYVVTIVKLGPGVMDRPL